MTNPVNIRHAGNYVLTLAISPDGACLAAAVEWSIKLWTAHLDDPILVIEEHSSLVNSLAFSPDGLTIASGSNDCTIRSWGTRTGNTTFAPVTGHTDWVRSVAFSKDGRFLASGSSDRTIRLWNTYTGGPAGRLIQEVSAALSVAISADGSVVVGGFEDGTLKLYGTDTGAVLFRCDGHTNAISSVSLSPDGCHIASGSHDHTVRIWDAGTGEAIGMSLEGHTSHVKSVAFAPDGRYIASASDDKTIRVWDLQTGSVQMGPLRKHTGEIWAVEFTPDGKHLLSGSIDSTIMTWDTQILRIQPNSLKDDDSTEATEGVGAEITSTTTPEQIISLLGARGCTDMTQLLDLTSFGDFPISFGGFGDIFRGKLKGGLNVAIKVMRLYVRLGKQNPKYLKHATRELYAWSKCKHANVQPLLGLVIFRNQIGMVSAWESNGDLPYYIEEHPDADRCVLSVQLSEGLSYLHSRGVIHGDLKGANVLVSRDGLPQLADFGNAVLQEYTLNFSKTSTKEALSARWAAPELFQGATCSVPADVYALGMTILETITGKVPWPGKSELAVMFAVTGKQACPERPGDDIPTNSVHGETLWQLLKWCWNFEPEKRPSAAEVRTTMQGMTQAGRLRR